MTALRVHETLDAVSSVVTGASALILIIVAVLIASAAIVDVERRAFRAFCRLT
ncbi:MAG TPA: hypothetical protein VEI95_16455 [Acidobacteriota bacterium]|nr:hypothetical protein [Acidobacteriota bacterium]